MSRGLGSLHRDALAALYESEGHELPMRELRRSLGDHDRSNLRRSVRSLLRRSLVQETREGVGPSIKLTTRGMLMADHLFSEDEPDPLEESRREWDELWRCLIEAKREALGLRQEKAALYPVWLSYPRDRSRSPGSIERLILYILWQFADPIYAGLPVPAVKAIAGGDKSNTRRAIRSLILRGDLDQTPEGERIRLSEAIFEEYARMLIPAFPLLILVEDSIDREWAEEVLERFGEAPAVVTLAEHCRENGPGLAEVVVKDNIFW